MSLGHLPLSPFLNRLLRSVAGAARASCPVVTAREGIIVGRDKLRTLQVAALVWLQQLRSGERGQTAVERVGIVFVVVALAMAFRGQLSEIFGSLAGAIRGMLGSAS